MSVQTSANPNLRVDQRPVDPRGPRFGAAITTGVFGIVIVLGPSSGFAGFLLALQVLAFAGGALLGLQAQPYGWLFRRFVRPHLGPPSELEDPAPPRFAQAVGLGFALVAALSLLLNLDAIFYLAAGMALAAAFLNAVFNFCLGCEMFLMFRRFGATGRSSAS